MDFYCFYLKSTNEIQCNRIFELDFVSGLCLEQAVCFTHSCMQSAWLVTLCLAFRDKYKHVNLTEFMSIYFVLSQKSHNSVSGRIFFLIIKVSQMKIIHKNLSIRWGSFVSRKPNNYLTLKSCRFRDLDSKYSPLFWIGKQDLFWYLYLLLVFFHIILAW